MYRSLKTLRDSPLWVVREHQGQAIGDGGMGQKQAIYTRALPLSPIAAKTASRQITQYITGIFEETLFNKPTVGFG